MWFKSETERIQARIVKRVAKSGYSCAGGPEPDGPGFGYSIGFWESAKAPEVILFGMPPELAQDVLFEVYRALRKGELTLADQVRWAEEPTLAFRAVHPTQIRRAHFNAAIWYRNHRGVGRGGLEAVQLVWPDTHGVFPWEEGYDTSYRPRQTELWLPYDGPPDEH